MSMCVSGIDSGADPGFQVRGGGGAHLKKWRRAEGGTKVFGVFRVKNHDFTPTNLIFSNLRGRALFLQCVVLINIVAFMDKVI